MIFPEFESERLKYVELTEQHADDLFEIYADPEAMKYWDSFPHKEIHETIGVIKMLSERTKNGTGMSWGIVLKNNQGKKIIGAIHYNRYSKNGLGIIGYSLNRHYWNKGIITETIAEITKFGFQTLEIHRIEAHVEPDNRASEKVLLKNGFVKEGVLREREFYKGQHQTMVVYGKLKSD